MHINRPSAFVERFMQALKFFLCALLAAGMLACASQQDRIRYASGDLPPKPFKVDGCTWVPDFQFAHCCLAHDRAYWQGGSCQARRDADRALEQCIGAAGSPRLGAIYSRGVRVGGFEWLPTPWRWGYGWPYGISCRQASLPPRR